MQKSSAMIVRPVEFLHQSATTVYHTANTMGTMAPPQLAMSDREFMPPPGVKERICPEVPERGGGHLVYEYHT